MKRALVIFIAALTMTCVFCACNNNEQTKSTESTEIAETTVVIETTAKGGTVEKDPEDNIITKDENGKVIKVVDKNGKTIEVTEYLTTHSWVEYVPAAGSGSTSGSSKSEGASKAADPGSSESSDKKPSETTDKRESEKSEEVTEGEIPVAIATVPDTDDQKVIPDP